MRNVKYRKIHVIVNISSTRTLCGLEYSFDTQSILKKYNLSTAAYTMVSKPSWFEERCCKTCLKSKLLAAELLRQMNCR